jgi:acetylornithine/succinyldiaminopimelate/putrescine aminotransferase
MISPDIITSAKGIGGGLPLGAIIANEKVAELFHYGMHGTTYGGNAVACAAGKVVLDELRNGLNEHVMKIGEYLQNKLILLKDKYPEKILEIRGFGLMLGLKLSFEASILVNELRKQHIIGNATSGYILRIVPPLIIEQSDVDEFIEGLDMAMGEIKEG